MNKEEIIARIYEEYYEMIKDMPKDNMIQGLYDLSKECIEKQNYINQLETICNNFMDYLDKNKLVLQNPNILDFYWEMKELARGKE